MVQKMNRETNLEIIHIMEGVGILRLRRGPLDEPVLVISKLSRNMMNHEMAENTADQT